MSRSKGQSKAELRGFSVEQRLRAQVIRGRLARALAAINIGHVADIPPNELGDGRCITIALTLEDASRLARILTGGIG